METVTVGRSCLALSFPWRAGCLCRLTGDLFLVHAFLDQAGDVKRTPVKLHQSLFAVVALGISVTAAHADPPKAAVFDFQFANLGAQEPTAADIARLGPLSDLLRQQLSDSRRYQIVSTDPVRSDVKAGSDLRKCGGCAEDYARRLGADVAITGEIQKVSNLILNINVYIKDLKAGTPEQAYSVDIRGNNDTSFERGIKYLVKNNLPTSTADAAAPKR